MQRTIEVISLILIYCCHLFPYTEAENLSSSMPIEKRDSGIDSSDSSTSEDSPSLRKSDMIEDDVMDETLRERLWGLTEMFPESLRDFTSAVVYGSLSGVKSLYSFTRSASWVFFTTTTILVAPVLFDVERTNLEEVLRQQQRQILLGPSTVVCA